MNLNLSPIPSATSTLPLDGLRPPVGWPPRTWPDSCSPMPNACHRSLSVVYPRLRWDKVHRTSQLQALRSAMLRGVGTNSHDNCPESQRYVSSYRKVRLAPSVAICPLSTISFSMRPAVDWLTSSSACAFFRVIEGCSAKNRRISSSREWEAAGASVLFAAGFLLPLLRSSRWSGRF